MGVPVVVSTDTEIGKLLEEVDPSGEPLCGGHQMLIILTIELASVTWWPQYSAQVARSYLNPSWLKAHTAWVLVRLQREPSLLAWLHRCSHMMTSRVTVVVGLIDHHNPHLRCEL